MVDAAVVKGNINRQQITQWLTTGLLAMVPIVVAYQSDIMAQIPPQYAVIAAIGFAALVQAASGARVRAAKDRVFGLVDEGQAQLAEAEKKVDRLNAQLEEAQAKIDAAQPVVDPVVE